MLLFLLLLPLPRMCVVVVDDDADVGGRDVIHFFPTRYIHIDNKRILRLAVVPFRVKIRRTTIQAGSMAGAESKKKHLHVGLVTRLCTVLPDGVLSYQKSQFG
jgi:hypothetical protein